MVNSKHARSARAGIGILLSLAGLAAAGCASRPYAVIDGSKVRPTDPDLYPVVILGVDGDLFLDGRREHRLQPGFHYLELATTKPDRTGAVTRLPFALTASPCVRYYIVAAHETRLDNRQWQPRVLEQEPLAACAAGSESPVSPGP